MDLRALQQSPAEFRQRLKIDADGAIVTLGSRLDPWQAEDFAALDPALQRLCGQADAKGGLQRHWLERPRGCSKTTDQAVLASWCLFASRRPLSIISCAADRDQAKLLIGATDRLCRLNPWLGQVLDVQQWRVANRHTGSELVALASDAASSYGLSPHLVVLDECSHWPNRDMFDSLISSAAKRAASVVVAILNAGWRDHWCWGLRETIRQDPSWRFSHLEGRASWLSPKHLAEQARILPPAAYARLWQNQWADGAGDALPAAQIDNAVRLPGPLAAPERGWVYTAGLDLGLKRDASALAVVGVDVGWTETLPPTSSRSAQQQALIDLGLAEAPDDGQPEFAHHPGSGRMKLADLRLWRPNGGTVDLDQIEQTLLQLHRRFGLLSVRYDPWQAQHMAQRLRQGGVPMDETPFVAATLQGMARATMESFSENRLDLYQHDGLLQDLRALRVVERTVGIRLESPRGPSGHGDSATALSLALLAAGQLACRPRLAADDALLAW